MRGSVYRWCLTDGILRPILRLLIILFADNIVTGEKSKGIKHGHTCHNTLGFLTVCLAFLERLRQPVLARQRAAALSARLRPMVANS